MMANGIKEHIKSLKIKTILLNRKKIKEDLEIKLKIYLSFQND